MHNTIRNALFRRSLPTLDHVMSLSELSLLALLLCLSADLCVAGETVYIESSSGPDDRQLRDALENQSVSRILFRGDYDVGSQFADLSGPYKQGTPILPINRNVTLAGVPGPGQPEPLLDLEYQTSVVELCDTCVFKIENMDITKERRGANAQLDFFMGTGNSVINLTNVIRKRLSCTPIGPALKLVESTARSPRFPARNGSTHQVYGEQDIVFRGRSYPRTLHLIDYSVEFPRHYDGGYSLVLHNVYRMCDNFVDPACLEANDADMCVYEHIGQLLASQGGGSSSYSYSYSNGPAVSGGLSTGAVAGIAVAVALVVAVLLAGGLLLWRRCTAAAAAAELPGSSSKPSRDVELGVKDAEHGSRDSAPPTGPGNSAQSSIPVMVKAASGIDGKDVQLVIRSSGNNSNNTESGQLAVCTSCDLHFGQLLGSGSFGRVYKGHWQGKDVAVKVIEHDSRMAPAVANEVQLMLSCDHPNVVRAYTFITHTPSRSQDNSANALRVLSAKELAVAGAVGSTGTAAGSSAGLLRGQSVESGTAAAAAAATAGSISRTISDPLTSSGGERNSGGGNNSGNFGPGGSSVQKTAGRAALSVLQNLLRTSSIGGGTPNQQQQHQQQDGNNGSSDSRGIGSDRLLCSDQILAAAPSQTQQQQQQRGVKSGLLGHALPVQPPITSSGKLIFGDLAPPSLQSKDDGDWELEHVKTWLIQEYCDCGTLAKLSNGWLPANEDDAQMLRRLLLLQDVVQGLSYLHGRSVVHGDLNARNVLITSNPASICGHTAKLADLGLSRTVKQHQTHHTTCTVGTMSHMPPELLRYGRMSTSVDIYSFGIMMWELYVREVAFRELHYGQFFETVVLRDLRPKVPPNMPEDYRLLMERCWATDPADRPSSKTLLQCIGLMIADRQRCLGLEVTPQELPGSSSDTGATAAAAAAAAGDGAGGIDLVGTLN